MSQTNTQLSDLSPQDRLPLPNQLGKSSSATPPFVKGGQGRSTADIIRNASLMVIILKYAVLALLTALFVGAYWLLLP